MTPRLRAASAVSLLLVLFLWLIFVLGLFWLIPQAWWDRLDGVSPSSRAGSEARDATSAGGPPALDRFPVGAVARLPDPVREEMALDCDPQQVASAIAEARIYRESMAGRTAMGQSASSPLMYRTVHGLIAIATELMIQRCLVWGGAQ